MKRGSTTSSTNLESSVLHQFHKHILGLILDDLKTSHCLDYIPCKKKTEVGA